MREQSSSRFVLVGLIAVLVLLALISILRRTESRAPSRSGPSLTEIARQAAAIEAREKKATETIWAKECLAERCGHVFEQLWDALNAATNRFAVLQRFGAREIVGPKLSAPKLLNPDIRLYEPAGPGSVWTEPQWKQVLREAERAGWQLDQVEFRHIRFETDAQGRPGQSRFYFAAHLTDPKRSERAIIRGDLVVRWQAASVPGKIGVRQIDASALTVAARQGQPGLRQVLCETVPPPDGSFFIDPLILYDLDGDGLSEIILAAKNLVYHRCPDGHYEAQPLCRHPPGLIFTGVIADFDGDGAADFLCARFEGLYLFKGSPQGTFDVPGRLVWRASPHLRYAQVLTGGDVDGDGDLDVWLGQYKLPYNRGQMPTPYYDANDGDPSYLLLNDGQGNFTDATAGAGLQPKRWRRAYSASFVDLNQDHHLDLVVASDFAGLDVYANDGHGHFSDRTRDWFPEGHAFGMSQLCADFNADGRLDLLLIGMNVPTMDRLQALGSSRPGFERYLGMGRDMTRGNRLFLGQDQPPFRQTSLGDTVARTGWSWGASAFDLDNDGFPDLYITNGHETRQSVQDYETEFWLHDIYVGTSQDSLAVFTYFQTKFARTRGRGMSYGGYEKNRLYLNQHGESFLEAAHLMGVALEQDSRNVVADDLDGDGRMDLLVTTFEAWPEPKQTLRVFSNQLEPVGSWIGFRLRERGLGLSPVGAQITLQYGGRRTVQQIVTGASYRSEHAPTVHFGLGTLQRVDSAEVRWPNGRSLVLRQPAINQYHTVLAPGG